MEKRQNNELTGIERELVLQYLIDGNVPVTVTELNDSSVKQKKTAFSAVFPVALEAKHLTVLKQGIILLDNPPLEVKNFLSKDVKVQFYFNKLGLYFVTQIKETLSGKLALVIPQKIQKIQEKKEENHSSFSAIFYFSANQSSSNQKNETSFKCAFSDDFPLFIQPKWSSIEEEKQEIAKSYLKKIVNECKSNNENNRILGNGLFLINICKYLSEEEKTYKAISGRKNPLKIIYIDSSKIVFAGLKDDFIPESETEYSILLSFPIFQGPIKERIIYSNLKFENIFYDDKKEKFTTVAAFSNIKEEDSRFLEDKMIL